MNNILLGFISIIITFGITVLSEKLFKKEGLFVWISIATILANILVCKSVKIFSFTTNLGNVLFASSFLAADIMTEKYGDESAKKAITLSVFSQITFIIMTQFALLYTPSSVDIANESMINLFTINLRVSISSILMYFVSNMVNIYLYTWIKNKIPKKLWLRNNISTIVCNCLENFIFSTLAFVGIFSIGTIFEIAFVASILEIIIAILDTPFLYLSTYKTKLEK